MSKKLNLGHITLIKNWIVSNFVSATKSQSFTDEQKEQARENIGVEGIIGKLSDLTTSVKTNIVAAINSIAGTIIEGVVTGVKGDAESTYRKGDVNITKANIGLGNVDNTSDANKPISTAQQAALDLKADASDVESLEGRVEAVEGVIPSEASSTNKLADKAYVEDLITTQGATYRGSVQASADTEQAAQTALASITTKDNNDFAYVEVANTPAAGFTKVKRYRYNGSAWVFEYALNNSGFTSDQLAALNSGITSSLVATISANATAISGLSTRMDDAESAIDTLEANVADIDSDVQTLAGKMDAAESNISTLQDDVTAINAKFDSGVSSSNKAQGKNYIDSGDLEATDAEVTAALNA